MANHELEDWQKQMIIQDAPDGTRTFIPLSAAPVVEIKDKVARRGLGLLTVGGAVGAAVFAINEFGDLARDCFTNNALWYLAQGVEPVNLTTCFKEGLEWGVLFVRGGQ